MIQETFLDKILYQIKRIIPKSVFEFFQPAYHRVLATAGATRYGFPSRAMKVIGVTGTKGKSTTVYMITKILEEAGHSVATIGTLGFKIKEKEWPNTLKQSMPGRFRLQKFLSEAKKAGCEFVVLEVTSEGIKQFRHLGVNFDTAVFVNLHREHLENHGSFENYRAAKLKLFEVCKNNHVINIEDANSGIFMQPIARRKITFGVRSGNVHADTFSSQPERSEFLIKDQTVRLGLAGEFNILNTIAAIATTSLYGVSTKVAAEALAKIQMIPGRMEFVQHEPFRVVVDYAHTPDSLEAVYKALKPAAPGRLIGVFGATGGGRDKWKRPEFGAIAQRYCDEIILTDDDPYEEDRQQILEEIQAGITNDVPVRQILDRKEAIGAAIRSAKSGDTVAITGKGSEPVMAIAGGRKIPWSDKDIALGFLS